MTDTYLAIIAACCAIYVVTPIVFGCIIFRNVYWPSLRLDLARYIK